MLGTGFLFAVRTVAAANILLHAYCALSPTWAGGPGVYKNAG